MSKSKFFFTATWPADIVALALTFQSLIGTIALAKNTRSDDESTNLRESCRRAASGLYLASWDKKLQTSRMVESVAEKLAKTEKSHKEEQQRLKALRDALRKKGYDLELAQQVDAKSGFIRTLQGQISQLQEVLKKSKSAASVAAQQEATRRNEMNMVFDILNDKKNTRPTRLDYKSSCPKYRFLCPLPRDHAIQLRESTTLEPCTRYAEQSLTNP